MKWQWWKFVLLGAVFYLVFVVAVAPATWLAWGVARATRGVITLSEPVGSVWNGAGGLVMHSGATPPQSLGQLEWAINPVWLLAARLQARVHLTGLDSDLSGSVGVSYQRARLQNIKGSISPRLLAVVYSPVALFDPSGQFQVSSESLQIATSEIDGMLQLTWQDAGLNLSDVRPLGDYTLHAQGAGNILRLKIETLKGALTINGQGEANLDNKQFQFAGTATPQTRATELEPVLRMLGNDTGGGKRTYTLNGRIPL